jgi:hypothetical protein
VENGITRNYITGEYKLDRGRRRRKKTYERRMNRGRRFNVDRGNEDQNTKQTPWPLVRERTIPTDRPPLVDEI